MKSTVRLIKLAPILLNMYVAIVLTLSLMDVEIASVSVVVSAVTSTILYFKHGAVKLTNLSRLFRHFADMIDNGYCDNITEDDIGAMTEVLKPYLNVKVNYEQAKKITGKTDSAFNSKISRCGLKPTKERLYRYIDMVKIKHKKV